MTDWVEDLKNLLGEVVDPENVPFDELAAGDWGGAATAPLSAAFNFMDVPLSVVKENLGGLMNTANMINPLASAEEREAARQRQRESGRAGWENFIQDKPIPVKVALELGLDPVNVVGVAGRGAVAGLRKVSELGRYSDQADNLRGAAGAIEATNYLFNDLPGQAASRLINNPATRAVGGVAKKGVERLVPNAFELDPKTRITRKVSDIITARQNERAISSQSVWGRNLPAIPWASEEKSLAPIDEYNVPPFFDEGFDSGVPEAVKQRAYEAYQRLSARTQSFPEIPGVNTPGQSDPFAGNPGFPRVAGGKPPLLDRLRTGTTWERISDPTVGFVNVPRGGYATPDEVRIDEDNLRDMAEIGLAAIMSFDNQHSNKLFAGILRHGPGFQNVRRRIIKKYGAGIEPYLPAMYKEFRELAADKNISLGEEGARFLTAWGFPQGKIDTKRLNRVQRDLDLGKITTEQAFERVINEFAKGSPQAIETVAGMGAGFLQSGRNVADDIGANVWAGRYASPGIGDNGRAIIPESFTSQFDQNKEAYNTYMRQLFGDLSPEELETLRQMSIEALYDELMNASGVVSGGTRGATSLLERGEPIPIKRGGREGFANYKGDEYNKIGVLPRDETSVAARDIPQDLPGGKHRQPSLKALNIHEAERVLKRKLTAKEKKMNTAQLQDFVRAAGGTPYTSNQRGGPLANTMRIVEAFAAGQDLRVGPTVAREWYRNAVDEVMDIVGPGRYEDAMMLVELMAVTSSGTAVDENARNALRAFAEWKLGSDDAIRNKLGLTKEQADSILNTAERWKKVKIDKSNKDRVPGIAGDEMFMSAMEESQARQAGAVFEEYIRRRTAADPTWSPTQGGPKTHNFAGSFVIKIWKDSVDYALRGNEALRSKVQEALDEAATIWTVDRHDSRIGNQATAVTEMGAISQREARILAVRNIPNVRPEDVQAATWYWSKDQQGFLRVERNDDMANALRQAWNEKADPGLDAFIREQLREKNPSWDEETLRNVADDLMRQEVVMAYLDEGLGKYARTLSKELGVSKPSEAIADIGDNVMGIVHRAGRGVMPKMKMSQAIPQLTSEAEELLGAVQRGESFGGTLRFDGEGFVPDEATQGFAVGITSAGTTVSTARRKTSARDIERFLGKYADIFDDPTVSEHLRFGVFKMDDGASFDLGIVAPDEATATELGRRFNQRAIYNTSTGETINLGGTGKPVSISPEELRRVVESVFGRSPTNRPTLDEVRRRGVTIEEIDSVNPVSIFTRKVLKPLIEQYHERSVAAIMKEAPEPAAGQGVLVGQPDPTSPFDFREINQEPMLSTQENMILSELFEGESIKSRLDRYYDEAEADIAKLDEAGVQWGPHTMLDERLKIVGDNDELRKIVRKYADEGIDIRYATPEDVEAHRLRRDMAKREGVSFERTTTFDLLRAAWGEQALFSPKYHLGNIQGAWLQNAFGGTFRAGTPSEFLAAFKLVRGGLDDVGKQEAMNALHVGQIAQKWGYDELPNYLLKGGVRSMTSQGTRVSGSAMGELAGKVTRSNRVGQKVGRFFEANADLSQGIETVMRGSLWSDVLDREMQNAMNILEDEIRIMADRQGLTEFEFSQINLINPVPGGPSPKRLKDHLQNLGFSEGYAERAGRNFAEARNKAEKMARAEVDKRQFSYDRTNLDEAIGKFIPFHYWYSRALRYYGEEALRHPYIILGYMRANEGIEAAQDDPGLDARQKGFIKLMGTPLGFTLLMNPDALFGVVKVFGIDSSYEPEGETAAGGVVRWLKERGMGLYPWIDGSLNLMGMYGDTFEPDLLGIRHKALIGSAVNFIRSQLGMDPAAAPYQTAMGQARWNVSSFVSQFAPDWLSQPVLPKAGKNTTEATMDTIIESRIIANNPGITNGRLLEIMSDPDSPEYNEAFKSVAAAGFAQQLLNFTAPQNYRIRDAARDVRNAKISTIYEAAEKQGVTPQEFAPTESDVEFAAQYKNLTGKEWKPGDYQQALAESDLTRSTMEYKPFVVQEQQFYALGGADNARIYRKYSDILSGRDERTKTLSDDERRTVAENWAYKLGYSKRIADVRQLRERFEASNPDFAEFRGWQDQMFSLRNHLGGNLAEYRRQAAAQNPNAARYFEEMIADVKSRETDPAKIESEIDRRTTNAAAYAAINGLPTNRYDPAPTPGFPQGDPTLSEVSPQLPQQGNYNPDYDWLSSLRQLSTGYGMNTQGTYWNQ